MVVIPLAVRLGVDGRRSERQQQAAGPHADTRVTVGASSWRWGRTRLRVMRMMNTPWTWGFSLGHQPFSSLALHQARMVHELLRHQPPLRKQNEALDVPAAGNDLDRDAEGVPGPGGELLASVAVVSPKTTISEYST